MATVSEQDSTGSNPIKEGLDSFRRFFESTRVDLGVTVSSDAVQAVLSTATTTVAKNLVLDLVLALQSQPVARILPSRFNRRTLLGDLSGYVTLIDSNNNFDIKSAIPLVESVVTNVPDVEIWTTVFNLVAHAASPKAPTPPTVLTPLRSGSASQRGVEQTTDEVDQRILEELTGRVYYDVGGFYEQYFEGKSWSNKARDIYEGFRTQYSVLSRLRHRYYTSANKVLRDSEAGHGEHDRSNVLVIGEHKRNHDEDSSTKTLLQLAGYAREVFRSQPDRRFVPGFTICGSIIRLWVFDMSGPYSSEKFDVHREPERFVKVIASYALMTDAELGLNTFIKRDENGKYIITRDVRISLEDKPIASTKAIVCTGTTCYRGKRSDLTDWEYVVKFAWLSDERQREGELLKLAKERGVKGITEWFNHEQVTIDGSPDTITSLRKGMKFGPLRKLSIKASWVDNSKESSRANSRTSNSLRGKSRSGVGRLTSLGITSSSTSISSRPKRKRDERFTPETSAIKRSRLDDSQVVTTNTELEVIENELDNFNIYSIEEPETDSLAYLVSPAGRPLHTYRSVREFLEALRDAITGHRSLLEDGKILHRDVSENNIIITESPPGAPKGDLIDLDLAKKLDSVPSGANHRTGTMQFMAIEVLQGKAHTYRHDLESFFYVFIWMCIRNGHEVAGDRRRVRPAKTSILRGWYTGTYTEIANTKRGHMVGFEDITAEFSPEFCGLKDLAEELRNTLLRGRDLAPFTGTYKDRSIMYDGTINAFNKAISHLGK
ncbi:hypothetical protein BJ875DRAFT_533004 [Amylocarpus encephaloides]|uniref:EKC/KEOPS complex subunit BUD32 n=1 Tax=Amylocarpus encephaloides TaxID=45428 RepID=A0A9P7YQA6_9HELO|nr:hypothetical protein BJ875DRAFT_533004 [Amylocarpus encephaloides]